ncbi:MAG: DICT sensory domain-containing protein [Anaerolineae bacterium]
MSTKALNQFAIDPNFSVYRLVERVMNQSVLLNHRKTMTLISYEIENATLADGAHTTIFSGFQRFSRFLTQLKRYQQLAKQARHVYVFGVPDAAVPEIPNLTYVPLQPSHQLSKEWFVVSYGGEYLSALATEELTHYSNPDHLRVFRGVWTFDRQMVSIIYEWLCREVNDQAALAEEVNYRPQTHVRLISNSIGRLMVNTMQERDSRMAAIIQGELKTIIKEGLYNALESLSSDRNHTTLREKNMAILFSDLRDFTGLAQRMPVRDLVEKVINPYMQIVSRHVYQHGGEVDKFLGDGVLAVFPERSADDCSIRRAVAAARDIMRDLKALPHQPPVGIGIDYGRVAVSQLGAVGAHVEETVIGDAVNTAQRLSTLGMNEIYLSQQAADHINPQSLPIQPFVANLRGKPDPQPIYRLAF